MGIRGRVQVKQPVYGNNLLSFWAARSAYEFLQSMGVQVYTVPNDANAEDADQWNIEIDDVERMRSVINYLNKHDDAVTVCDDCGEREYSKDFSRLLQEGLDAAIENKYAYIIIEWW